MIEWVRHTGNTISHQTFLHHTSGFKLDLTRVTLDNVIAKITAPHITFAVIAKITAPHITFCFTWHMVLWVTHEEGMAEGNGKTTWERR